MKLFSCSDFECTDAEFVICGAPFDKNYSYREGAADAPDAIRDASWEIETYLIEKNIDACDLSICDIGNLDSATFAAFSDNARKTVDKFRDKKLIIIGGDHSITFPFVSEYKKIFKNISVLSLDAHFDLREEYQDSRDSNASVMRRVSECIGCENLFEIGTRAACRDDFLFAKKNNINFIPYYEIREKGLDAVDKLLKKIKGKLYLSIDMDVIDSALAPGVENPEAEGLSVQEHLELIRKIFRTCDVVACDVVEVAPKYDNGITSMLAARTIYEILGEWAEKK